MVLLHKCKGLSTKQQVLIHYAGSTYIALYNDLGKEGIKEVKEDS